MCNRCRESESFKEAQAVQPGKSALNAVVLRYERRGFKEAQAVQPGKSEPAELLPDAAKTASKRPRPFSPGNFRLGTLYKIPEPASKRPRPFSPGNSVVAYAELTDYLLLQRGPGRSAREMSYVS